MPTRPTRRLITISLLIAFGVVGMSMWSVHQILHYRALRLHTNDVQAQKTETARLPAPTHIYSQWFLDVAIDPASLIRNEWSISDNHASYLTRSARPGEIGNIILYGHNKREILGNIRAYTGGEPITLTTTDGKKHIYKVVETHEVEPTEVKYLQPTEEETLTIYTCSGFWDRKRFIVIAKPV